MTSARLGRANVGPLLLTRGHRRKNPPLRYFVGTLALHIVLPEVIDQVNAKL